MWSSISYQPSFIKNRYSTSLRPGLTNVEIRQPESYNVLAISQMTLPVADPGFPVGRRPVGGHQPLTHTLFSKNVCKNERN